MSCKPILFSTPMVQAILAGRKTMTRRVIKLPVGLGGHVVGESGNSNNPLGFMYAGGILRPKYRPGDILWVRETWMPCASIDSFLTDTNLYAYKADCVDGDTPGKWRPSIYMPKDAARLFLRMTGVRVERVQDISEADADAEGVGGVDNFIKLWDTINTKSGLYKWKNNPFVWTICFERVGKDGKVREIESP